MDVIGNRPSMLILREAFPGTTGEPVTFVARSASGDALSLDDLAIVANDDGAPIS
jgi:hypothetical protein